ncbi:bifunctional uroporphyrinogen-III C-methyltransferase/uroporphyrinogen-III synthase [Janibacter sp. Soil728]|uniref:uroporphyrinogen-III synthase n=1 Tax=Janibacter sp. Soil728 TaxID=1736393 RepID=UPI0006FB034A|nr:uroporphyrinogen-III synthase [Janibacter sp. Soil728]KRE37466.1 bifunctional uroporphyrinogen-III C-methyltransferase/uroporphyrinogen-III synthase [Janibacter sp. Soil728]
MTPQRSAATPSAASRRPARVAFVGAGPGDVSLMTVAAVDLLGRADAVITDQLTNEDIVASMTGEGVDVVDASHGEHGQQLTHAMRARLVVKTAKAHKCGLVVRLMDGDPATFNGLAEEAQALVKAGIDFDIVPGVSAVSAVPAYAGVPLTSRSTSALHVVSVSGGKRADLSASTGDDVTLVLLGLPEHLSQAFTDLLAAGRAGDTPVALTRGGTTTHQTTRQTTLEEAAETIVGLEVPTLAVIGSTVALRENLSWFETKPLYGWRVLIPRTKDQAGPMTKQLLGHGATSQVVPTISVEPPRTPQAVERAVRGLVTGRYQWIGFTSVNAVKAIREKFQEFGLDARAFSGLKIAAVGGVTADALRDWGLEPDLVPTGEMSAKGLLEEWPPYDEVLDPMDRVFLPRADIATDTLVAGLQDMGWQVDDVTAYRTVRATPPPAPVRDAIKQGAFDAVVFTSSSTVRNLVGIAGKPHPSTVIACIGPATVKTAEEAGLRVDVMAPEATGESLVEALAAHGRELAAAAHEAGEEVTRPSERRKKSSSRRKAKG